MSFPLAALSHAIPHLVAQAAPLVTAIRIAPGRHTTGILCRGGAIVTTEQTLPPLDSYTVVLSNQSVALGYPGPRDPASGLAVVQIETAPLFTLPCVAAAVLGGLVVVLGAEGDASPNVRLTVIHRFIPTATGPVAELDLAAGALVSGSAVLDAEGRLIGLATCGPNNEVIVIPGAAVSRMLQDHQGAVVPLRSRDGKPSPPSPRGWLGAVLQPITVPAELVARVGQTSGRMVVSVTTGGPAHRAGLRVGDVLLALNNDGVSARQGLRAMLAEQRSGSKVRIRLLRDAAVKTIHLVVSNQP
jgi:S1-C subfamily serine protease